MIERHHPGADMRNPNQQALAFQTVNGLAQRATAYPIGASQFRFGDLAARGDLAFDDGRLDTPEDVLRERFRLIRRRQERLACIQHIVDTLRFNSAKAS